MSGIPPELVKSLTELGLLESEARIYVALVMMNSSDVKELIDFLGMSKPNAYEGLRSLEEKGLIVPVSERPIVYQAVAPEIVLEMLIDIHMKAKKEAMKLFAVLPRNIKEIHDENIWFIFSDKNLEYKIKDLIKSANKSIIFGASEKYVKFLKPLARKDIEVEVMIFTDNPETGPELKKMFKSNRAHVHVINRANLVHMLSIAKAMNQGEFVPAFENIFGFLNYENLLILVADDADFLYVPPVFGDSQTAMNSKNRLLIDNMKMVYQAMLSFFGERTKVAP
jgi:sugar-specific transcriptional regulator TrmB